MDVTVYTDVSPISQKTEVMSKKHKSPHKHSFSNLYILPLGENIDAERLFSILLSAAWLTHITRDLNALNAFLAPVCQPVQ